MRFDNPLFGLVFELQQMLVLNRRVNQLMQIFIYHKYGL